MNWRSSILRAIQGFESLWFGQGANVNRCYRELLRLEFAERPEIQTYVQDQLIDLLRHSAQHVPYYRDVLKASGVIRDGFVDLDRFTDIPPLTKEIMRSRSADLQSDDTLTRRVYRNTSSGSTGVPVEFFQDGAYRAWNRATRLFFNHVLGKEIGEREVLLAGSDRDLVKGSIGLTAKTRNFLSNRLLVNSNLMSPEIMQAHVTRINRFRPVAIFAYVESAYELARFVETNALEVCSIPATIVTGGTLTDPFKETIERGLNTKVYNQYGSREVGPVACECPQRRGLHVFEWASYVEILDDRGREVAPGETGELCITLLTNRAMPIIRYRIGDRAVASDEVCSCGRNTRLLKAVTGRTKEHFVRRDGSLLNSSYFVRLLWYRPWLKRFQIVQEDLDHVILNMETTSSPTGKDRESITAGIRLVLGETCAVEFRELEAIPPLPSGKFLYTISKVKRENTETTQRVSEDPGSVVAQGPF